MSRAGLEGLGEKGAVLRVVEPVEHACRLLEVPLKLRASQGGWRLENRVRIADFPEPNLLVDLKESLTVSVTCEEGTPMLEDRLHVLDVVCVVYIGKGRRVRPCVLPAPAGKEAKQKQAPDERIHRRFP